MSKKSDVHSTPKVTSDVYFKQCMTDICLARDFLRFNLPENIKNQVDLDTLALAPQEYITAALRRKIADVVYTVKLRDSSDGLGYLSVVVEHQSEPRQDMPLRMLELMITMTRQILANEGQTAVLPVVIPLILSNHARPYPYSTRFLDLFSDSGQSIISSLLNDALPLVDLASMPDAGLKTHLRAATMELALKKVKNSEMRDVFLSCVELLRSLADEGIIDASEARNYAENLVCYIYDNLQQVPSAGEVDDLMARAENRLPAGAGGIIVTLREHFEQRGVKQGIQQEAQRIALKMLRDGIPKENICRYAEISVADLDALERKQLIETEVQH